MGNENSQTNETPPLEIALVAGEGTLPLEIARRLTDRGTPPVVYSLRENVGALSKFAWDVVVLSRLDLASTLADMKGRGIRRVLLAGVVPKTLLYQPAMLDAGARELVAGLAVRDDHSLLAALVQAFERLDLRVEGYRHLIEDLMAPSGEFAGRPLSEEERADVAYGMEVARVLLPLSFGQTVVVHRRSVVAVEAMEGTDAALLRAGSLCKGGTVVKMMRVDQDDRYDLPTVGPRTLHHMARAGLRCLAVEAGRTIVLEPQAFRETALAEGIAVTGVTPCPSS